MITASWPDRFAGLSRLSPPLKCKLETAARIRRITAGPRIF